ncbi:hypothetical protein [Streptomyces sp. WZ-12]|uniref:hypothetical protein n=1 Tax=Streptomyces sp. WZ-12 TaxID=3030210 RepID=UPI002380C5BA|nr:hypothetical protein [Streptomyces sp. WZ-12]
MMPRSHQRAGPVPGGRVGRSAIAAHRVPRLVELDGAEFNGGFRERLDVRHRLPDQGVR